jgi:hypothetical protein
LKFPLGSEPPRQLSGRTPTVDEMRPPSGRRLQILSPRTCGRGTGRADNENFFFVGSLRAAAFESRQRSNSCTAELGNLQRWMWGSRMAFEPDIIITTADGRIMVIEAKVAMTVSPQ